MSSRRDVARQALARTNVHPRYFDQILSELARDGLVESDGALHAAAGRKFSDKLKAAQDDPPAAAALKFAEGALRRAGLGDYEEILDGHEISVAKLDRVLANALKPMSVSAKTELKTALARAGLMA